VRGRCRANPWVYTAPAPPLPWEEREPSGAYTPQQGAVRGTDGGCVMPGVESEAELFHDRLRRQGGRARHRAIGEVAAGGEKVASGGQPELRGGLSVSPRPGFRDRSARASRGLEAQSGA